MFCSCSKEAMSMFKDRLYDCFPDTESAHTALGIAIIKASDYFTTTLQPLVVSGKLAYGLTSYGDDKLYLVYDDSPYAIPVNNEFISDNLPIGLRKAARFEEDLHRKNVKKYHLENVSSSTKKYYTLNPQIVYHRSEQWKVLSKTRWGRLWFRILKIYDRILCFIS